jgi:hypothetical protein
MSACFGAGMKKVITWIAHLADRKAGRPRWRPTWVHVIFDPKGYIHEICVHQSHFNDRIDWLNATNRHDTPFRGECHRLCWEDYSFSMSRPRMKPAR